MSNKNKKNVNYLGRDFSELTKNLQTFVKSYYPDTYKDFSESSPGQMLIELAAYVGDVLGFHMDKNLQELFSGNPQQRKNAIELAKRLGYKPKASVSANTYVDLYVVVPATGTAGNRVPNDDYCPIIKKGTQLRSSTTPPVIFETIEDINFATDLNTDLDNGGRKETIWEEDENGFADTFLLQKRAKVISGKTRTFNQSINEPQKYLSIELPSDSVSEIIKVTDSDDNQWYEVDSLAQDTIFSEEENTQLNDVTTYTDSGSAPYLLKLRRVPKRFTISINEDNLTYLNFGAGIKDSNDEEIIPNPKNVGAPILNSSDKLDYAVDPENFLRTRTYGEAPANTTLSIEYREGGGIESNVPGGTISNVTNAEFVFPVNETSLNSEDVSNVKSSISCDNPEPATGGKDAESNKEIIENAFAELKSQKRCMTKEDYIVRAYSLPAKYGNIAKVYVEKDDAVREVEKDDLVTEEGILRLPRDPFAINMYVMAYDNNKNLTQASYALKKNLKNYLSQYRILTDSINIVNGNIINIEVNFEIKVTNDKNKNNILVKCVEELKEYFDIDKWNFNQPIVYSDIAKVLTDIEGVKSIPLEYDRINNQRKGIWIKNKTGGDYSNVSVDIDGLTQNGIIYPPKEISIFEVKKPDINIKGRIV